MEKFNYSWLIIAMVIACPLLHIFMHRKHGEHENHGGEDSGGGHSCCGSHKTTEKKPEENTKNCH